MLPPYAQSFHLGHRYLERLLDGPVVVQEKYDGSQFSFGVVDGCLSFRSKGTQVFPEQPDKLFEKVVNTVGAVDLQRIPGAIYRGESLRARKHNALEYDRMPKGGFVLYDVEMAGQYYLDPQLTRQEALRLSVEPCQLLWEGYGKDLDEAMLGVFLNMSSSLGGPLEGIVIKNYTQFGVDKKFLLGKLVRPEFKEAHKAAWNVGADPIDKIIGRYTTPMRWEKAIQHVRERGELTESVQDIGTLLVEIKEDVLKEHADDIKDALFAHYRGRITRGLTSGFPAWYKQRLGVT